MRRVVVSGLGAVTPLAVGMDPFEHLYSMTIKHHAHKQQVLAEALRQLDASSSEQKRIEQE